MTESKASESKMNVHKSEDPEFILKMIEHAEQSVVSRRSYEWKVNLLIWSGVPIMTGFLAADVKLPVESVHILGVAFLVIWLIYTFCWQRLVQTGHGTDRALKNILMDKLISEKHLNIKEKFDYFVIRSNGHILEENDGKYTPKPIYSRSKREWNFAYSAITLFILGISWVVLFATAN